MSTDHRFKAVAFDSIQKHWTAVDVIPEVLPQQAVYEMCIKANGMDIYITREQAREFFLFK